MQESRAGKLTAGELSKFTDKDKQREDNQEVYDCKLRILRGTWKAVLATLTYSATFETRSGDSRLPWCSYAEDPRSPPCARMDTCLPPCGTASHPQPTHLRTATRRDSLSCGSEDLFSSKICGAHLEYNGKRSVNCR